MIRMHSKFIIGILLLFLAFPGTVFAQAGASRSLAERTFCERIDEAADKFSVRFGEREARLSAEREEGRLKMGERHLTRETRRTEHRSEWDLNRDEFYRWLNEFAQTDEEQTAVARFQAEVDAAVLSRRDAVDLAVREFRAGIDTMVTERKEAIDDALGTFKKETDIAIAQAKAACDRGVLEKANRETFASDMRSAQEKFTAAIKGIEKKKDTLTELVDSRKAAIDKAVADFKIAIAQAKAALQAAFMKNSE